MFDFALFWTHDKFVESKQLEGEFPFDHWVSRCWKRFHKLYIYNASYYPFVVHSDLNLIKSALFSLAADSTAVLLSLRCEE